MRPYPVLAVVAAAALASAACASAPEQAAPSSAAAGSSAPASTPAASAPPLAPDAVAVSPGGVTTEVGAPAESTEDDYFQNCRAARTFMDQRGGDPKAQIEPYLKMLQSAPTVGAGEFAKSWAHLSAGQQSAIIVAVDAAADALCG